MATKKLAAAFEGLDPSNDDHWTADGRPNVRAVNELAGEGSAYTRDEIDEEWGDRTREEAAPIGEAPAAADQGEVLGKDGELDVDLDENPDAPKITGFVEGQGSDRIVKLGDEVVLFTPNPINAQTRNLATVTRLNSDGTINAAVKRDNGLMAELSSVKNHKPDSGIVEPYWQWAADKA